MEREICGSGNELNGHGIYFTFHVHSLVFSLPNQMNHDILGIYKYICWKESQSSQSVSLVISSNVMRFGQGEEGLTTCLSYHLHQVIHSVPLCVCVSETHNTNNNTVSYRIISSHQSFNKSINQSKKQTNKPKSKQPTHYTITISNNNQYPTSPSPTHNIIQGNAIHWHSLT